MTSLLDPPQSQRLQLPWSHYQKAIFDFVENGTGNAVIIATAGSGKTSTLLEALNYTPDDANVAYVAFNKHISQELKSKAPDHIHVSTLHSLGLSNIRNSLGKVVVDKNKTWKLIDKYRKSLESKNSEIVKEQAANIKHLISLMKATLTYPSSIIGKNSESLDILCDKYGIYINDDKGLIYRTTINIFMKGWDNTKPVDFDDMIFWNAAVPPNIKQSKFDYLFIDEGQDLNAAQIQMVLNSIHENSRVIIVGDPNQSVYAFSGVELDAIDQLTEKLNATTLPLSISYRCPTSHIKQAQSLVPTIEAADNAIEGSISNIEYDEMLDMLVDGDLVICRTNAPLVLPAFELIRQGKKAIILGRDIGNGLQSFVKKIDKYYRPSGMTEFVYHLRQYGRAEISKLANANKLSMAAAFEDKVLTTLALAGAVNSVSDLIIRIGEVFSDTRQGITFGTIHKVKGGEAERVFLLEPDLIPHKMAKREHELLQEQNIKFIAYTRSKSELYFVNGK